MTSRGGIIAAAVAAVAGFAAGLVFLAPSLRPAYENPGAHIALETSATLIAGLVGLLLYGRYRRTHLLQQLLLAYAMGLLSLTAFVFAARAAVVGPGDTSGIEAWSVLLGRTAGALLILAAALVPPGRRHHAARPRRDAAGLGAALLALLGVIAVLDWGLPDGVNASTATGGANYPTLAGSPLVLGVQILALPCYLVAAVMFTRQASRTGDALLQWFGAAAFVGTAARVAYLWSPTQYSGWISLGDVLRLGFFVLLLVGAIREIQEYWAAQVLTAAESERRRIARDLHDGVIQELGYITHRASRAARLGDGAASEILAAASRAADEARRSIDALTAPADEELSASLERAAMEVGDRYDVKVHFAVDGHTTVSPAQRDALGRILREAVSNAARHGAPDAVWVSLGEAELIIHDDGRGFATEGDRRPGAFGLISMRERAAGVGGALAIASAPGDGTTVRVTW
jgi:signal transduction histidine kinase